MRAKKLTATVLGIVLLFSGIALPAGAGVDLPALLRIFGAGYVVDLFSEQLDNFVNTVVFDHRVETRDATKVVPIVSIGTGVTVGAAQVSGARDQVAQVQAVGEIDEFEGESSNKFFRARVLVPLNGKNPLGGFQRVSGVGVSAIIDLRADSSGLPGAPGFPPGTPEMPGTPLTPLMSARRATRYAIFADEQLAIHGEGLRIIGDVHVNGELQGNGGDHAIVGSLEAGGDVDSACELQVEGRTMTGDGYLQSPDVDFPALRARAQKVYPTSVNISGFTDFKGIIYVDGDAYISGRIAGKGGIVATGRIYVGKDGIRYATPGSALFLMSGKDILANRNEIRRIDAFLAAPYGLIRVGGLGITIRGGLIGRKVELTGERITVIHDESPLGLLPEILK